MKAIADRVLPRWWHEVPDDPFYQPRTRLWYPAAMRCAPKLPSIPKLLPKQLRLACLIQPFYPKDPHGSFGKHVLTPSLTLTSLAAATPAHWQIQWWDENLLQGPPPHDPLPEVVGITVHLTFAQRAYELAAWYRQQGCKVILGGLHVVACQAEAAPHADALVVGNGAQLWSKVLLDIERNSLQKLYADPFTQAYHVEPPPHRHLASPGHFLTSASLVASRGCRNRCGFCYLSTRGLIMPYQTRSPADIRQQFELSDEPYGVFLDNNLGADRSYLRALCEALRPLKKIWSAAITLDVTDDPSLVRAMALAGCTGVFIGLESLSNENLQQAHKQGPQVEDYPRRISQFHANGIQVNGSFVLGFDGDHRDVFKKMADWIESSRLECATFHILTPYPGTPLFRQMETEGRILHYNWDKYDTAHAVFRPRNMSPEELESGYDWLYRRLFSWAGIWQRRPAETAAVMPYLAMAVLYKRSNRFWYFLIKHRLVHQIWSPLIHWSRWRHLKFRNRLQLFSPSLPNKNDNGSANFIANIFPPQKSSPFPR